jgi:L-lactate utilization protein LutB
VLPQRKQASLGRRALHRRQKKVKQLLQEQNKVQVEEDEKSMVTTISRVDLLEESLTKDCEISSSKQ